MMTDDNGLAVYRYTSLPQPDHAWIRLLRLLPGQFSEPLICVISSHERTGIKGEYLALSYVWGERTEDRRLWILNTDDGKGKNGGEAVLQPVHEVDICVLPSIPITDNLFSALRRIRALYSDEMFVWADAVCINQGDNEEKSQQVADMGETYQASRNVFCWLGENNSKALLDLHVLNDIDDEFWRTYRGEQCDNHYEAFDDVDDRDDWMSHVVSDVQGAMLHGDQWNLFTQIKHARNPPYTSALLQISGNPYFTRQWIQQEVCLGWESARAYLGEQSLSLYCLYRHMVGLDNFLMGSPSNLPSLASTPKDDAVMAEQITTLTNAISFLRMGLPGQYEQTPLRDWLELCSDLRCGMPQDKVFGLLSVVEEAKALKQKFGWPNYDLDAQTVYSQVATHLIESLPVPGTMLSYAVSDGRMDGLPSWVPDWSRPAADTMFPRSTLMWQPRTSASTIRVSVDEGRHLLHIPGVKIILKIQVSTSAIPRVPLDHIVFDAVKASMLWSVLSEWWQQADAAFPNGHCGPVHDRLEDAFQSLLITKRLSERYGSHAIDLLRRQPLSGGEDYLAAIPGWLESVWRFCHGQRLAVLDGRYIGLVPLEVDSECSVAILSGAEAFCVLKRSGDGLNQLVGFAQIHGLAGDAILDFLPHLDREESVDPLVGVEASFEREQARKCILPEMFVLR